MAGACGGVQGGVLRALGSRAAQGLGGSRGSISCLLQAGSCGSGAHRATALTVTSRGLGIVPTRSQQLKPEMSWTSVYWEQGNKCSNALSASGIAQLPSAGSKSRGLAVSRGAPNGLGLLLPWRRTWGTGLHHGPSDPLRVRGL